MKKQEQNVKTARENLLVMLHSLSSGSNPNLITFERDGVTYAPVCREILQAQYAKMFRKKNRSYGYKTLLLRAEELIAMGYITRIRTQIGAGQYPTNSYSVTELGINHLGRKTYIARAEKLKSIKTKKTPSKPIAEPVSPGQKNEKVPTLSNKSNKSINRKNFLKSDFEGTVKEEKPLVTCPYGRDLVSILYGHAVKILGERAGALTSSKSRYLAAAFHNKFSRNMDAFVDFLKLAAPKEQCLDQILQYKNMDRILANRITNAAPMPWSNPWSKKPSQAPAIVIDLLPEERLLQDMHSRYKATFDFDEKRTPEEIRLFTSRLNPAAQIAIKNMNPHIFNVNCN